MGPAKAEPQLRERSQLARAGKLYERRCVNCRLEGSDQGSAVLS
jgi:hypothetical protein